MNKPTNYSLASDILPLIALVVFVAAMCGLLAAPLYLFQAAGF